MIYTPLFRMLIRRWWIILLPPLLAAVVAIPQLLAGAASGDAGYAMQLRYSASQRLPLPRSDEDYSEVWLASQYTVDAFTDWARTSSFRDEIGRQLGEGDVSLDSLVIAADNARSIGVLYFSHADRDSLAQIGDAAIIALAQRNQSYFPQLRGEAAQVTILDSSPISANATPLSARLAPIIQLGVAVALGLALALFAEAIDPTIYHADDLPRLGLTLVGAIPAERA